MMEESFQNGKNALTDSIPPEAPSSPKWAEGTPAVLPITTLLDLFNWYRQNLCGKEIVDPRGYRVTFLDTDFVHLIKLTDKYGKEPKNRRMTIEQIQSGRITLNPSRIQIRRAQELSWARPIIESPTMIVPNWQAMGRAIPGDAYIKNFGTDGQPINRVLICGYSGKKRWAVTIFPRERFADREIATIFWP
jgi:hypothetical protein